MCVYLIWCEANIKWKKHTHVVRKSSPVFCHINHRYICSSGESQPTVNIFSYCWPTCFRIVTHSFSMIYWIWNLVMAHTIRRWTPKQGRIECIDDDDAILFSPKIRSHKYLILPRTSNVQREMWMYIGKYYGRIASSTAKDHKHSSHSQHKWMFLSDNHINIQTNQSAIHHRLPSA